MGILATSIKNESIFRPAGFYVIGFTHFKLADLFLIFLGFVYIVTVVCNVFIVCIICLNHHLHTPKYIAVANLGVIDLMLSTSIIPSAINTVLTKDTFMSYDACVGQIFFYYGCLILESFSLLVLAYDRLIAICFPLRHNSINTPKRMIIILAMVWMFVVSIVLFLILIMMKLSFCDSLRVDNFFCEYSSVIGLSCNDNTMQWTAASALSMLVFFAPFGLIVITYASILTAVFRMKSIESRYKALGTCTEHLILLAIFFLPLILVNIVNQFLFLVSEDVKMLSISLCSCIPSCLNPIVYSLATKEIRMRILTMLKKSTLQCRQDIHRAKGRCAFTFSN